MPWYCTARNKGLVSLVSGQFLCRMGLVHETIGKEVSRIMNNHWCSQELERLSGTYPAIRYYCVVVRCSVDGAILPEAGLENEY